MVEFARARLRGRWRVNFINKLFKSRSVADVDETVGIRHPEIYVVFGAKLVAKYFFAVDVGSVAAAHVLEDVFAIRRNNTRLLAADAAVAKRQLIAGLPPNAERHGDDLDFAASTAGFYQNNSRSAGHGWFRCTRAAPVRDGSDS